MGMLATFDLLRMLKGGGEERETAKGRQRKARDELSWMNGGHVRERGWVQGGSERPEGPDLGA